MKKILTNLEFENIESVIKNEGVVTKSFERTLAAKFKVPVDTISSIVRNYIVRKTKANHLEKSKLTPYFFKMYSAAISDDEPEGIILRIAYKHDYSPALVSKCILEQYLAESPNCLDTSETEGKIYNVTKQIAELLKDTSLIDEPRLAREIYLCSVSDSFYGHIPMLIRKLIGEEYEERLKYCANKAGLSYWTEEQLRSKGYDKTPDLQLIIPVALGDFIINWIESKGTFGDPYVHKSYIQDQYFSYWNRFGPGLVIYWMGYVNTCANPEETRFIVRDDFPEEITHLKPLQLLELKSELYENCPLASL